MAKDIKFNIKLSVDGKEQLVTASTNVKDLANSLGIATGKTNKLRQSMATFGSVSMALQGAMTGIQQLSSTITEWTDANNVQVEAETKLATVMRQRMQATEEEIESIKQLAAEQQKIGIIGDEVQLAGAQQIATFLSEKDALQALIPAMNNLVAQQKGYTATSQDAVTIANMMGKVMQGQTSALKRVGITFTEAQEEALKYGTELERANVLAQIITDNVGQMNTELAKTDAGKAKQLSNYISDLKEQLGSMFSTIQPAIVAAGQLGLAISAVGTTVNGVKAVATSIALLTRQLKAATAASTALKVAIRGAFIATGIGAAIAGITALVEHLTKSTDDAVDSVDALSSANNAYQATASSVKGKIDVEIASLANLVKSHKEDDDMVKRLNATYGQAFGVYSTCAEWYEVLIKKSQAYVQAKAYEAQAIQLATKMAEKEMQLEQQREALKSTQQYTGTYVSTGVGSGTYATTETKEWQNAKKAIADTESEIATLQQQMQAATNKMTAATEEMSSGLDKTAVAASNATSVTSTHKTASDAAAGSLQAISAQLTEYEKTLRATNPEEKEKIANLTQLISKYRELKAEMEATQEQQITDAGIGSRIASLKSSGMAGSAAGAAIAGSEDIEIGISVDDSALQDLEQDLEDVGEQARQMSGLEVFSRAWGDVQSIAGGIQSITAAIEEDANAWQIISGVINGALQIAQGISGIVSLIQMFTAATSVSTSAQTANAAATTASSAATATEMAMSVAATAAAIPEVAATKGLVAAYVELAAARYMAAHASIPFVGYGIAAGYSAAAVATVLSIGATPFAQGGVVSGPTLALVGEYSGASNNPEVIAPLDKLRDILQPQYSGGGGGRVDFRISGNQLVGVLANQTRMQSVSGKRTNIQI